MESYAALYRIYDAVMSDVDHIKWTDYMIAIFNKNGVGKGAEVFEAACGTGNITVPLKKAGYDITAADISGEMLEIAVQKARGSGLVIPFVRQDMREAQTHRPVDAVICCCDGVNYLTDRAGLIAFFRHAHRMLRTGGLFTFDIVTAYRFAHIIGNKTFYDISDDRAYVWQNAFDPESGVLTMDITLFIRENEHFIRFDEIHRQRAWTQPEIVKALSDTGFRDISAYAFQTFILQKEDTQRIQFVAIKA